MKNQSLAGAIRYWKNNLPFWVQEKAGTTIPLRQGNVKTALRMISKYIKGEQPDRSNDMMSVLHASGLSTTPGYNAPLSMTYSDIVK